MEKVKIIKNSKLGFSFFEGEEKYIKNSSTYFRDQQVEKKAWRPLTKDEIAVLNNNRNSCSDWSNIQVCDPFNPDLITNTKFYGLIRIGQITEDLLRFHDLTIPQGITNSTVISCDIGDNCAIHECNYLSHYIIEDRVILHSINEMQVTNHAKFGVGIIKEGEDPEVRIDVKIMNEAGGRYVYPFTSMTCGDAWIWGSYRGDIKLMSRFDEFTKKTISPYRGWYGVVKTQSVIKSCRIIKDVNFGEASYVKGANKLKNLTVKSSFEMTTQIGEGVELVNGIIGKGCRIFYGCKAVRFVMMDCTNLKYGARLINSILGENSTVSCCEVLNNLVFPGHEQHHNNSFLIATNIQGLSNMAAGANIGSNHNSRGADGEIVAKRGFWPALSSTLKHNCKFASYTLIAKGNYPDEINLTLPFCLLSSTNTQRLVMPAYWWMYNLYALERNSFKVKSRDRRKEINQIVHSEYLAPDTALEILEARRLLRKWVAQAWIRDRSDANEYDSEESLQEIGHDLLHGDPVIVDSLEVTAPSIENSNTPVLVVKAYNAYKAYGEMLVYYGVREISQWMYKNKCSLSELQEKIASSLEPWENVGGQLVFEKRIDALRKAINERAINSWDEVHQEYKKWNDLYEEDKLSNAIGVLKKCLKVDYISEIEWEVIKKRAIKTRIYIENQVFETKVKDYNNPFRDITYRDNYERDIVLGAVEENPFINESAKITKTLIEQINSVKF